MTYRGIATGLMIAAVSAAACAFAEEEGDNELVTSELRGGCHWECPRCAPHDTVCSMRPCQLICNGHGPRCGNHFCPQGEVCCNESCGICTPPGGFCTMQYCEPIGRRCDSDADCRLFADYCTGCDCRALLTTELDPTCDGPGVRCFADPCLGQAAVCDLPSGRCQLL